MSCTLAGAVLLLRSPASSTAAAGHSSAPPASRVAASSAPPASQAAATGGPVIPASFAGTWSGTATQSLVGSSLGLSNPITFTLEAGGQTAHEENLDCVNTLTLTKVTATVLTFDEPEVAGACVGGTVTFTRTGSALAYLWTNSVEQNAGDLRKAS